MAKLVALRSLAVADVLVPVAVGAALLSVGLTGVLDGPAPPLLWLGLGALAVGVAPCLDDPAAPVTAATPVSERRRMLERQAVPATVLALWAAHAALVDGREGLSGPHVLLTGAGVLAVAVAAAGTARRLGRAQPGAAVGSSTLLLVVACTLFQPLLGDTVVLQAHAEGSQPWGWVVVLLLAVVVLWWASADPGRRPYIRPTRLRLRPGNTVADDAPKRASTTSASTLR